MGAETAVPAALPVSLEEVKALLRIGNSEEDALIAGFVRSAAATCEAFTGRVLIDTELDEVLAASRAWSRLGAGPVRAIEDVAALDADGSAVTLAAAEYALDIDACGDGWVRLLTPPAQKRVRVRYRAGLAPAADPNGIPEPLRQGIARLAAHLHAHREAAQAEQPPAAVAALWRPWRRLRLR
jgi:uncharacterized phiE125 gp8 family phage protein